jgi:RNA-directed DNA polymerase
MSHGRGKSDRGVVPKKLPNKAVGAIPVAAEAVEGRLRAKGNAAEQRMSRRSMRVYDMQTALDGIRQTARGRPGAKFTTLKNHIYQPERLQAAYLALKRDAAAGVDGQTWASYGQDLQANLLDLSDRLGRGGYRPQPVKRVYIDKADGSKRPPGKSAHNALDAVAVGVQIKKVNWIFDADISKFFDTIDHDWLVKFIEHRVADARVVRLIKKWLHAGVLEDGQVTRSEQGTVQGGSISPLLANIYLHYVLDLWGNQWRGRHARGDMVIVRYADDWVAGFERRQDAERFAREVTQRLQKYGLALNATKTRLIEFGRFARDNRQQRGQGKPETFDFLGFTHCCGTTSKGKFMVLRLTSAKRMRAKLHAVKDEMRRRMHRPIAEQGQYLRSVVAGHARYFGVPDNGQRMQAFRFQVVRIWHRTLKRRSQSKQLSWRRMSRLAAHWVPPPRICHPYPNQRLIVTTQGKSRMR